MKIVLVTPNSRFVMAFPRLGPLYLASYLKNQGYNDIAIVNARHECLSDKALFQRIQSLSPDVLGISALSMELNEAHRIAKLAKENNAGCIVIMGGPYATSSPEHILKDPNVDFAVLGEGERTAVNLIGALEHGDDFSKIEGLAYKKDGNPVVNPMGPMIEDLDSLPFPAWDMIDIEGYFNDVRQHSQTPIPISNRIAPLITSRGCPYRCTYCHNIFGKKIRFRSVEHVLKEIEILVNQYKVEEIEILDDCFNFDLPRAKRICDEIIRRGIKVAFSFANGLRVDRMDEELVVKLKEAGTRVIYYAIESASPRIQEAIHKNLDLDKARRIIAKTLEQGIVTCGYFMFGFPGETKEEMLQTLQFAKDERFHIADFFYVVPQPNTEIFNTLEKENIKFKEIDRHTYHRFSANVSSLSDAEMKKIGKRLFREFYLRPRQMWRIWNIVPNKAKILEKAFLVALHSVINCH